VTRNVLLVDDHEMIRAGLRAILEQERNVKVIGEAEHGRAAVKLARDLSPHVILMDLNMPEMNGVEATRQIVAENPDVKVIALSVNCDRQFITAALQAGAVGYLMKNSAAIELGLAIKAVMKGEVYLSPKVAHVVVKNYVQTRGSRDRTVFAELTPKQREVLQLLAEGKSNKEIAKELGTSTKTVETHRAQLMEKLNIHTVAGLTKYAVREGLTSLEA
jgi:DNA-binding NarL/FixJ family response regulator